MIEFDYGEILGEEEVAEYDKKSGFPVIWGKRLLMHLTEQDFDHLRMQNEVIGVMEMDMVYFVVTKRFDWDRLRKKHGEPVQVGLGTRGGFKWARMTDDTYWSHTMYREGAKQWIRLYPRFEIKCNKQGEPLKASRCTIGRSNGKRKKRRR